MAYKGTKSNNTEYPLVSVVIPSYNCEKYIAETVESVITQTYRNIEIIVIDDGSTDNTAEILSQFEDRIQYIYQINQGSSKARNVGLRMAKGEYIAFLDADDRWHPTKIEIQVNAFRNLPEVDMIFTDYSTIDGDGNYLEHYAMEKGFPIFEEYNIRIKDLFPCSKSVNLLHEKDETRKYFNGEVYFGNVFEKLFMGNFILPSTEMFKRNCIHPTNMFNEDYKRAVDQDFHLRFSKNHTIAFLNLSTTDYRVNISNKLSGKTNIPELITNTIESRLSIIRSNDEYFQRNNNLVNNVLSKDYARLSYYYLSELNNRDAMIYAIKSIKQKRIQSKGYYLLFLSIIPKILLNILKIIKNTVKKELT